MEVEFKKIRLPSGREVSLLDALNFCYDIADTEYKVLKTILAEGEKTEDELAEELSLSKASVNRALNRLVTLGFIVREKEQKTRGGRPRYIYKSIGIDTIINRIAKDLSFCAENFSKLASIDLKPRKNQQRLEENVAREMQTKPESS
ncbi:MAG: HTH-type transcriptional regulator Lrs14 [Sulfolobaceae archaeon]|nr:HTH-type transcriptional regulator Lrs14 [Sulfolobaceae archaeon]